MHLQWLNGSCLACDFCQTGDEPLCAKALLSGYTVDGTFQQYAIAKAAHVARIPKDVPLDAIAPILCAGITVYKGLKESGARPGQTVAIVGAGGGLGSLACQYAKAMGLEVIGIDTGDEKEQMVKKLGAHTFVDFAKSSNLVKDVQAATEDGLGPHAVILVAVNEKPFQQATEYLRPRGTVICIGLPAGAFLRAPVFETVIGVKTIKGSYVGNRKDTSEAIEFYRRGLINAPFKTIGMSELQKVYGTFSFRSQSFPYSYHLLSPTTFPACILFQRHVSRLISRPERAILTSKLHRPYARGQDCRPLRRRYVLFSELLYPYLYHF